MFDTNEKITNINDKNNDEVIKNNHVIIILYGIRKSNNFISTIICLNIEIQ